MPTAYGGVDGGRSQGGVEADDNRGTTDGDEVGQWGAGKTREPGGAEVRGTKTEPTGRDGAKRSKGGVGAAGWRTG